MQRTFSVTYGDFKLAVLNYPAWVIVIILVLATLNIIAWLLVALG